ncbi:MAG: hypothetical protein QM783_17905 [Phycisphaerales bacterium]
MRSERPDRLLIPTLTALLIACLLGAAHLAQEWLPPISPPSASPWSGLPMPINGGQWSNGHDYRVTGSLQVNLRGRFYTTGVDTIFITLSVTEDDVPVEVDDARRAVVGTFATNIWTASVTGNPAATWSAEVSEAVGKAAMTPGTKVSTIFKEQQFWERLMQVRAGVLSVLWVALPCSIVWLCVRAVRRMSATREARHGRCSRCGYELAGLPDGEPCPECATPAVRSRDPYLQRLKKKEWKR